MRHRGDDHRRLGIMLKALDGLGAELQPVQPELLQVVQRGMTGAEIVEHEADATRAQGLDHGQDLRRRVQHRGFGDLQLQPGRRQSAFREHGIHHLQQPEVAQLVRRQVDRQAHGGWPACRHPARFAQRDQADAGDQAVVLGQGDEVHRRDHAAGRMPPTQQGLDAGHVAGRQAHDGLELQEQGAGLDGIAQFGLHREPRGVAIPHVRLEQPPLAPPVRLRRIQREVCVAHEAGRVAAVPPDKRYPDTDADRHAGVRQQKGLAQPPDDPWRQGGGRPLAAGGHQDRELVAAQPRDQTLVAHQPAQPRGHGDQQRVPGRMAEAVVDRLEPVKVKQQQAAPLVPAALAGGLQRVQEGLPVGQPGEAVMGCHVMDALLGAHDLGPV